MIFIIGSCRSGTHLVAKTLKATHIEVPQTFAPVGRMATYGHSSEWLRVSRIYKTWGENSIIKDHAVMWLDGVFVDFPKALFVYCERHPCGVAASILKHAGALNCSQTWRDFPWSKLLGVPQRFPDYESMSLCKRIGIRLAADRNRAAVVENMTEGRFYRVRFSKFFWEDISKIPTPHIDIGFNPAREDAWKSDLSKQQITDVIDGFKLGTL
jgi:hypothetical protein